MCKSVHVSGFRRCMLSIKSPFTLALHSRLIPDFDNPFPVMGTGMENCIPNFWDREWESKIAFPNVGNGNGNEKLIPNFREREWKAGIPGNGREREFPLTPVSSPSPSYDYVI